VDPAFKERVTATFDGFAAGYDTGPGGFFGPVSDILVQVAGLRPGQAVLDVGCEFEGIRSHRHSRGGGAAFPPRPEGRGLHAAILMMFIRPVPGIDVPATANPSAPPSSW
jgi:hypothetical protein